MTNETIAPEIAKALDEVVASLRVPLMLTMNGACVSFGKTPPEIVILSMTKAFASVIGEFYRGDDDGVRNYRELCRSVFSTGLHQSPVLPVPKQQEAA